MSAVECFECGRTVSDGVPLCELCAQRFAGELRTVPGLVVDITVTRSRLDRLSSGRVGGRDAETALPIRAVGRRGVELQGQRAYDALVNALTTWGRDIEERDGVKIPIGGYTAGGHGPVGPAGLVQQYRRGGQTARVDPAALSIVPVTEAEQVAVWLADHVEHVRSHPAADEMITEIADAIARCRMAVDKAPDLKPVGPCPTCATQLRAEKGDSWVRCPACGEQCDVERLLVRTLASADDVLMTVDELVAVLREIGEPVPVGTIRSWISRRRLARKAFRRHDTGQVTDFWYHRLDRPMYRLGDVRALRRQSERSA